MSIADCTCYHDCRVCPQSGELHQHSDEPCPLHPDVIDETGDAPLGAGLQARIDREHREAIDASFAAEYR